MAVNITRKENKFYPDPKRVFTRLSMPGEEGLAKELINRILKMSKKEVNNLLNQILTTFSRRHRNITISFQRHFEEIPWSEIKINPDPFTKEQKLLIGAYFTMEYSIESAAFFNPSVVEDPNQSNLDPGHKRVIVSFRATGEGHISSITFRNGVIDENSNLTFIPPSPLVDAPEQVKRHVYAKTSFAEKLKEMNIHKDIVGMVLDKLGDKFIYGELQASIAECMKSTKITHSKKNVIRAINWLAESHYEITFSLDTALSARIIFPISYTESNGIEDARFVRFTADNGEVTYYATYTAYNGFTILPKFLETKDFYKFNVTPINGKYAQNKGMALFPRKINGKYAMISRLDGVNNFIMFSDNIHLWQSAQKIEEPRYPWELMKIGNCGSPLETEKGWLVITHGVGPMREYCLGATLLDLKDPTKVIGHLKDPLLSAAPEEREGYVPNVVYSCGSIIHNNELIIPYGMSDYSSSFATTPLPELLNELLKNK